ncbi:PIN domain-containing protein [Methylobacterium sp. J-048]|uniref:PIN domain-containing protein n=1 Tax=Methylobacterium sp. J-048 TaxID=2836635 RepID=UPI001FBA647C|nr:PIN domain-containing protein [Methylobacterium sp. J-048]MCJ2059953.1 PIN domain-containing protein [Methylobacterium sp. J-048]
MDTNVISRRQATKDDPDPPASRWIRRNAHLIRISAVTIAEVRRGLALETVRIERLKDARARRRDQAVLAIKTAWYGQLRSRFADRIVAIDADVAERWADVSVRFPSLRDGDKAILATALVHRYGIATRNLSDFKASPVPLVNPFDPATWWGADSEAVARPGSG